MLRESHSSENLACQTVRLMPVKSGVDRKRREEGQEEGRKAHGGRMTEGDPATHDAFVILFFYPEPSSSLSGRLWQ